MRIASLIVTSGIVAATLSPARADTDHDRTIRVSGQATVRSRPDRVVVDVGVVTRAPTSQQAASQNAREARSVISSLERHVGKLGTVETVSYLIQSEMTEPQPGAERKIAGYTATHLVRVALDDVSRAGSLIDAAITAGGDQIQSIRFTLKDEDAARERALRGAALDAREKANVLARSLGVRIRGVRSIQATDSIPRPMFDVAFSRVAAATPIAPAAIETTASVTLTIDFAEQP